MNTECRIYNPNLELQGIIDEFTSLIWIRRYQVPGEFELRTPCSPESRTLLVPENIIQRFDGQETTEAGVIENITMNPEEIIVRGRMLESYLDRRLIKDTTYYSGEAEDSMRRIITEMVEIPLLSLGTEQGYEETLEFQRTYKSVLNTIQKVCKATGLGFRIRPDFSTRDLYFEVLKGADRTAPDAAKVVFSEKYDNLLNEEYTYDSIELKTKGFASQVINDVRVTYPVGGGTGLELREVLIETSVDTDGKTTAQIKKAMEDAGLMDLATRTVSESFTFSTDADAPFVYRTDYDVGDMVHVKHIAWGIDLTLRITEIEEDYQNGGRDIVLVCGSPLPETVDFEEE